MAGKSVTAVPERKSRSERFKFRKTPLFAPVDVPELDLALDRMKVQIGLKLPAWRALSSLAQLLWVKHPWLTTAATDGWFVYWNPEHFKSLSEAERVGVWVHEVSHIIRRHDDRGQGFDPHLWNMACDYVINLIITDLDLTLPKDALLDESFRGMTEYEVACKLQSKMEKEQKKQGDQENRGCKGDGDGQSGDSGSLNPDARLTDEQKARLRDSLAGGTGDVITGVQEPSEADRQKRAEEIQQTVARSVAISRAAGSGVCGLEDLMEVTPQTDRRLRSWLERFVRATAPSKVSWARMDRRMYSQGVAWPGKVHGGYAALGVAIDTSGSMSRDEIKLALEAVKGTFDRSAYSHLIIVWFTGDVWRKDVFKNGQPIELPDKLMSGGTSFYAAFESLKDENIRAMIVFTDGGDTPPADPGLPVLWVYPHRNHGPTPEYGDRLELRGALAND